MELDTLHTPLKLKDRTVLSEVKSNADMFSDWKAKVLHGKYPLQINDENIDKTGSLLFTKKGCLFPETEGSKEIF